jgi:hypothetical protein
MGVGASNMSTSDLSVYQDALTKISSDLISTANNASSISLNSRQIVNFSNGGRIGCDDTTQANKIKYINLCQHGITDQTYPPKSVQAGEIVVEKVGCDYFLSIGAMSNADHEQCLNGCSDQANKLFTACTPEEIIASTPTINCSIGIYQTSNQTATTTQAADNNIDASMTTAIASKFESAIDKTISQKNKDFNFMQQNTSDERTALSQSIRNDVRNAISQTSDNISSTFQNQEQVVNFTNQGIINCSGSAGVGCGSNPAKSSNVLATDTMPSTKVNGLCTLVIDQSNLQTASTNQKAAAALKSVFDNIVSNELASSYSLKVDQTNTGVNLAELLLTLLLPLIFLILFVPLCLWAGSKVMGPQGAVAELAKSLGKLLLYGGIVAGIAILILWSACQMPSWGPTSSGPTWCYHPTLSPTSSATASPSPTPRPRSQNVLCAQSDHRCTYSTYSLCNAACTAANITACQTVFDPNTHNAVYCGPC